MTTLFSNLALDFVQIAAGFLLLMALVFGEKSAHRFWTNLMHVVFALQCLLIIVFRAGALPKLVAGLMLLATIIIRLVLVRRTHAISKGLSS